MFLINDKASWATGLLKLTNDKTARNGPLSLTAGSLTSGPGSGFLAGTWFEQRHDQ